MLNMSTINDLNVLHVCETVQGGVGAVLTEIISETKFKHHLLIPSSSTCFIDNYSVCSSLSFFNRTGRDLFSFARLILTLSRTLKTNNFDIIILHSSFAGVLVRAFLLLSFKRNNYKLIYYPHGISLIMPGQSKIKFSIRKFIECVLARYATDAIVSVSHYEASVLRENNITAASDCMIYNGVNDLVSRPRTNGKGSSVLKILFVGRFDPEKGVQHLLKALEGVNRSFELTLVGGFTNNGVLSTSVEHVNKGWLQRDGTLNEYQNADLIVIPSEWEAFGMVAVEAMMAGKAVFASDVGGLKELISDGYNGVKFKTISELTELIQCCDLVELERMGLNGRLRYEELFSSEKMGEQLSSLIKTLVVK